MLIDPQRIPLWMTLEHAESAIVEVEDYYEDEPALAIHGHVTLTDLYGLLHVLADLAGLSARDVAEASREGAASWTVTRDGCAEEP